MNYGPEYFDKAASWATDTRIESLRSRRNAWIVAAVAVAIVALQALALALLVPLKTVQPITLLVDRQTGFVQAVDPASPRRIAADDALTQSFLAQYVTARERFDRATLAIDYRKVALMSSGSARSTYLSAMPDTNPASPLRRLPADAIISVRIKSVSQLEPGVALVRFDTEQQSASGGVAPAQQWISLVRYAYSNAPLSLEDRLVNPLGFKVLSYRRNAEAPPPEPPPQPQPLQQVELLDPVQQVVTESRGSPARGGPLTPVEVQPEPIVADRFDDLRHVPMGSPLSSDTP